MISIFQILREDHQSCREMIQNLIQEIPSEDEDIGALAAALIAEVQSHERAEEQALYETLKERSSDPKLIREVYLSEAEHQELDFILNELATDVRFGEELRVHLLNLHEALERHWAKEEEVLFARAHELLTQDEELELGSVMVELRDMLKEEILAEYATMSLKNKASSNAALEFFNSIG